MNNLSSPDNERIKKLENQVDSLEEKILYLEKKTRSKLDYLLRKIQSLIKKQ